MSLNWTNCIPYNDVLSEIPDNYFFADILNVVNHEGSEIFSNPAKFWERCYLSNLYKEILLNSLKRVFENKGESLIIISSPFGGGKSHLLVSIYHLFKNIQESNDIYSQLNYSNKICNIKPEIILFSGTAHDPIKGRTIWGELFYQAGKYNLIKSHDLNRVSPGKNLIKLLFNDNHPEVILIDEIFEYISKVHNSERKQIISFLQEISEVIATKNNSLLIITLPQFEEEFLEDELVKEKNRLIKILGRIGLTVNLDQKESLPDILKKNLFKSMPDDKIISNIVNSQNTLLNELNETNPEKNKSIEEFYLSYPFHPGFISVLKLFNNINLFQKTRDSLKLTFEVIKNCYDNLLYKDYSFIYPFFIDPLNQKFLSFFNKFISESLFEKLLYDLTKISPKFGDDSISILKYKVAVTIMLFSLSNKQLSKNDILRLIYSEGVSQKTIDTVLKELNNNLWYLHNNKEFYLFKNEPNINKYIFDLKRNISNDEIYNCLKQKTKKLIGKKKEIYFWPSNNEIIKDSATISIVILSPQYLYPSYDIEKHVEKILHYNKNNYRVYKNGIFCIVLDREYYINVLQPTIQQYIIKEKIKDDKLINEIDNKIKNTEYIDDSILNGYCWVAYNTSNEIKWEKLNRNFSTKTIYQNLKEYLESEKKLVDKIIPSFTFDILTKSNVNNYSLNQLYNMFFEIPGFPLIESKNILIETLNEGAKIGYWKLESNDNDILIMKPNEINRDKTVLKKDKISINYKFNKAEEIYSFIKELIDKKIIDEDNLSGSMNLYIKENSLKLLNSFKKSSKYKFNVNKIK